MQPTRGFKISQTIFWCTKIDYFFLNVNHHPKTFVNRKKYKDMPEKYIELCKNILKYMYKKYINVWEKCVNHWAMVSIIIFFYSKHDQIT